MRVILALSLLLLVGCSASGPVTDHYYVQSPLDAEPDSPWVILLPGGDGLNVMGDRTVYFEAVDELARAGHRVCLIDYRAAHAAAEDAPGGDAGRRIAWAVDDAVRWLQDTGQQPPDGAAILLVSWSLGAEGVWQLTEEPVEDFPAQINGAAVYYPANIEQRTLARGEVPLLIQTGAADNLTPVTGIREMIADRPNTTLLVYDDAYHGFDASRLPEKMTVPLFRPGVGPFVTFGYQPRAAKQSHRQLLLFLDEHDGE